MLVHCHSQVRPTSTTVSYRDSRLRFLSHTRVFKPSRFIYYLPNSSQMLKMFNDFFTPLLLWKSLPYIRSSMWPLRSPDTAHQRLQSDLQRTRLSRHRLIWLLPRPLSSLPSASCFSFSAFLCVAGGAYWRIGGRGLGGRSHIIRLRESLVLQSIQYSLLSTVQCSGYWLTFSSFTSVVAFFVSFAVPASYSMY